jgi:DNA-binding transcriptional ArsR family regulator
MEDLIKTYLADGRLAIPKLKIRQAIIFGDHSQFRQEANDYVLNLFVVGPDQITTPLIRLSILRLLLDVEAQSANTETKYFSAEKIADYLEPCGISRNAVFSHLKVLLNHRLVDPYDPTDVGVYEDQRVRVSHCGHIHFEFALKDDVYFTSMALTTGVRSAGFVDEVREIKRHKMDRSGWQKIARLFTEYLLGEDQAFISLPNIESYDGQVRLRADLKAAWIERNDSSHQAGSWL